jgi:hypothetical protein
MLSYNWLIQLFGEAERGYYPPLVHEALNMRPMSVLRRGAQVIHNCNYWTINTVASNLFLEYGAHSAAMDTKSLLGAIRPLDLVVSIPIQRELSLPF